jgi:hypothetical protein
MTAEEIEEYVNSENMGMDFRLLEEEGVSTGSHTEVLAVEDTRYDGHISEQELERRFHKGEFGNITRRRRGRRSQRR